MAQWTWVTRKGIPDWGEKKGHTEGHTRLRRKQMEYQTCVTRQGTPKGTQDFGNKKGHTK